MLKPFFFVIGGFLLLSCTLSKGSNFSQQQIVANTTKLPTFTVTPSSPANKPNSQISTPVQLMGTPTFVADISTTSIPTTIVTSTYTPQPTTPILTIVPMTTTLVLSSVTGDPPTLTTPLPTKFVTVSDSKFMLDGHPHYFVGANFWQGMNLGVDGPSGNRAMLVEELDRLQELGVTNLRIMASSEGPDTEPYRITPTLMISPGVYNESVFDGLDYFLMEIGKHDMRAVMVLNNYWQWSGGMAQYVSWYEGSTIPYPTPEDWLTFLDYSAKFYECRHCQIWYRQHISTVINHHNPYTGLKYRDDPTIFSWELANEPRRYTDEWIDETSAYIKSLDPNHLVTTGSEGTPPGELQDFIEIHNSPDIDYATIHIWPQNWGWYDPTNPASYAEAEAKARSYIQKHNTDAMILDKPFVLEEFGLARDWEPHHDIYNLDSPTISRDIFFAAMFDEIFASISSGGPAAGTNFWVWSGQVQPNDVWYGDPPHEIRGWYSIFDTDESTKAIISAHSKEIAGIQEEK